MDQIDDDEGIPVDELTDKSKSVSLSAKIIFILICACNIIQNAIVGGSNNAIMTTLESGFYMTSTETGLFQSVYELVAIFSYPLVGYFGDRSGRKVRWISVSMGILACGFLVMSFPHLLESKRGKPPSDPRLVDHLTLCNPNRTKDICSVTSNLRFLSDLKYVFYLSNIINACGSAALPTLAVTLIEDLFPPEKAPIAQGLSKKSTDLFIIHCFFLFRHVLRTWRNRHWPWFSRHITIFESLYLYQKTRLVNTQLLRMGWCLVVSLCLRNMH